MPFLSIQNISITFGKTKALDKISIDLERGEYLVVLGPSGAGKTSLLKCIAGLYHPDSGIITINNQDVINIPPEERSVAYMPQTYALFNKMDVWGNVSYGPKIQRKSKAEIEEISNSILEMVHLEKRKTAFPNELSGGMKQRTALARSLATRFPILLLDEPLRALDARLRIELRTELKRIVKELGFTVLHVTHDQNEAMAVADRILILNQGKVVQIGTQYDIYFNPKSVFVPAFMDEINHFEGKIKTKELLGNANLLNGFDTTQKDKVYYKYTVNSSSGSSFISFSKNEFTIEESVDIVIKGESIRVKKYHEKISEKPESDENDKDDKERLHGKLISQYFLGNWSKLRVIIDNFSWVVKLPSVRSERYETGEQLELSFKPVNVILLAMIISNKD